MKFIASSSALLKQLSAINGVIVSNPVVPILENFLFELEGGKLTISASDLQTSMITEMDVTSDDQGSIAIPAKILLDTLKNLPEQPITLQVDENTYGVELVSANGRYRLSGENATDFPKINKVQGGDQIDVASEVLLKAISSTIFAASNDELRPAMTGILMDLNAVNATFVATDGHRLVRFRRNDIASDVSANVLLPRKALNLLKSTLTNDSTPVKAEFTDSNAYFSFGGFQMICRLIDERFPDYENVIPLQNPNQMLVNRMELLNSLKRISIYANKTTNQVRFKISASELVISAEDLEFSNEANEKLSCDFKGTPLEIGFNAKFLIEMLNNMDSEQVTLELSEPNKAGIFVPADADDNEDLMMLVMPVMLNNYV